MDLVGGNGLTYGGALERLDIRTWGYPIAPPYDTQTHIPHQCQIPTSASGDVVPNGIRMACAMTGGASGGPWTDAKYGKNRGDVIAVTSARKMKLVNGVKVPADSFVHGAPNTENTKALYDHREAENAS